jgi:hypothetical protein
MSALPMTKKPGNGADNAVRLYTIAATVSGNAIATAGIGRQ